MAIVEAVKCMPKDSQAVLGQEAESALKSLKDIRSGSCEDNNEVNDDFGVGAHCTYIFDMAT